MERLTERNKQGYVTTCFWKTNTENGMYDLDYQSAEDMIDRLAAYEDAMPLERAQELTQAEKDGRLMVLPCKVGDTVYIIRGEVIIVAKVEAIHQWISGKWKLSVHTDKRYTHWVGYEVCLDDFGKTVFLTREEAEAALKKREGTK